MQQVDKRRASRSCLRLNHQLILLFGGKIGRKGKKNLPNDGSDELVASQSATFLGSEEPDVEQPLHVAHDDGADGSNLTYCRRRHDATHTEKKKKTKQNFFFLLRLQEPGK